MRGVVLTLSGGRKRCHLTPFSGVPGAVPYGVLGAVFRGSRFR